MPWLLALILGGCDGGGDTGTGTCSTGTFWNGGDEESPQMHPGGDCMDCHDRGEGPTFSAAGTVMGDYTDETDCDGIAGVTVRITDVDGTVHELLTNAAGNFYTQDDLPAPLAVELEFEGRTRAMSAAPDPDCMTCHTAEGENSAPGRILAP
jgi:hypothetical protein